MTLLASMHSKDFSFLLSDVNALKLRISFAELRLRNKSLENVFTGKYIWHLRQLCTPVATGIVWAEVTYNLQVNLARP